MATREIVNHSSTSEYVQNNNIIWSSPVGQSLNDYNIPMVSSSNSFLS